MNYNAPHSILLVNYPRVRLALPRLSRVLGPGVYHFEGDLRPRFASSSQVALLKRGAIELFVEPGDTPAFLRRLIERTSSEATAAGQNGDAEALDALNKRLSFLHTLAAREGVDLKAPVQATITPDPDTPEVNLDLSEGEPEAPAEPPARVLKTMNAEEVTHVAKQLLSMTAEARNAAVREIKESHDEASYTALIDTFNELFRAAQAPAPAPEATQLPDSSETVAESDDGDAGQPEEAEVVESTTPAVEETTPEEPAVDDEPEEAEPAPEAEPEEAAAPEEPETDPEPEAEPVADAPHPDADKPATVLNGIGAKTLAKLEAIDLGTLGAIAASTPAALAQVDTISEDEAIAHIAEARERLGLTE